MSLISTYTIQNQPKGTMLRFYSELDLLIRSFQTTNFAGIQFVVFSGIVGFRLLDQITC